MIEKECEKQCEKCIEYTNPLGEIRYKCNDDLSKDKVIIIVSSVIGGIVLIVVVYVTVMLIIRCKKKKKEREMNVNHITPGFETYFNLHGKCKLEPKKGKSKSRSSIDSKELNATPIHQRIEQEASEHTNQVIIYSMNNSNMKLKTKSKVLLNTMLPQNNKWNYQVNKSPSPKMNKNKVKLVRSMSPKKNVGRDRRRSHFFENNRIGRLVDNIMLAPHK